MLTVGLQVGCRKNYERSRQVRMQQLQSTQCVVIIRVRIAVWNLQNLLNYVIVVQFGTRLHIAVHIWEVFKRNCVKNRHTAGSQVISNIRT